MSFALTQLFELRGSVVGTSLAELKFVPRFLPSHTPYRGDIPQALLAALTRRESKNKWFINRDHGPARQESPSVYQCLCDLQVKSTPLGLWKFGY